MRPRTVVLLGGGGHASDVLTVLESSGDDMRVVVSDDEEVRAARFEGRAEVLEGDLTDALAIGGQYLTAVGYPPVRQRIVDRAARAGAQWHDAVIHTDASVHPTARLGVDTVVLGQSWLSAHVTIDAHSHVGYGVTVGHDTTIGSLCSLMPGSCIGGEVAIADGVLIGANSTVLQGVSIGANAVIGAGSVVIGDVPAGVTVLGVPATERSV